jgi:hypothetical protein
MQLEWIKYARIIARNPSDLLLTERSYKNWAMAFLNIN